MAKINPIKVRQEAEKAEKAGKLDQAIPLYRQLLEDNPRDWNTINKIGDLLAKIGRVKEAADEYAKVAEFYARDGFHLKAIAIWKKIQKLDAASIEPYAKLADLYAKQGLVNEAKSQYQVVAEDYLKRGRNKDAAEVLRKLVEIDPGDLKTRSRLADIYTREGSINKAVQEYSAIANELHLKGHPAEAIQVLEKGLKLDPSGVGIKADLGKVHLAQKSFDKAIAYFEEVTASEASPENLMLLGQGYLGARRVNEAQATLESVLKKAPANQEARVILIQVYSALGKPDDAYDTAAPLVDQLLLKRDVDRAQNLLAQIASRTPNHIRTLQKLVEVARVRQNDRAISQALNQLLEAHVQAGALRAAQDTAQQLVDLEPQNEQFKARLESLRAKKSESAVAGPTKSVFGAASTAAPPPPPVAVVAPPADELGGMEFATGGILRTGAVASAPADKEFVEEHLAEARVFRKYGLTDKSEEQVEIVLARFPYLFDARLERKELYKETQRASEAAAECLWLARDVESRGDTEQAKAFREEAEQLVPGSLAAGSASDTAEPTFTPEESTIPIPEESPDAPSISMELSSESVEVTSEPTPEAAASPSASDDEEEDLSLEVTDEADDHVKDAPGIGSETGPFERSLPAEESLSLSASSDSEDEESLALDMEAPPSDAELPGLEALPASGDAGAPFADDLAIGVPSVPDAAATPPAPAVDPELARLVEEIDSYVSLGFVDDAKDVLRDALQRFPADPQLLERASSLGFDQSDAETPAAPAPPPVAAATLEPPLPAPSHPAPPPPVDDGIGLDFPASEPVDTPAAPIEAPLSFDSALTPPPLPEIPPAGVKTSVTSAAPPITSGIDLGAELSALFEAQPALQEAPLEDASTRSLEEPGLQDIFNEFKKGVDQALGSEDYDTRYNLGIAYKEMGLIDEAISEFQLAAKDVKRSLECSSMIGICFLEKGVPDVAIQWFEKGLKVPGRAPEEYRGLKYDLGSAWEATGDRDMARQIFGELYAEDSAFRDVSDRFRSLKGK